jgi:hypothetical protein
MNDHELLKRYVACGDAAAFAELLGRYNIARPANSSRDDVGLRVVAEVLAVRG